MKKLRKFDNYLKKNIVQAFFYCLKNIGEKNAVTTIMFDLIVRQILVFERIILSSKVRQKKSVRDELMKRIIACMSRRGYLCPAMLQKVIKMLTSIVTLQSLLKKKKR